MQVQDSADASSQPPPAPLDADEAAREEIKAEIQKNLKELDELEEKYRAIKQDPGNPHSQDA